MGERVAGGVHQAIVRVPREHRPEGPAENALVLVERSDGGAPRARYTAWIGYGDLDLAKAEDDAWTLVEPAAAFEERVEWLPFGWPRPRGPAREGHHHDP